MIINVQADLIAWNRARNNELRHTYRRISTLNDLDLLLLDQYQQFFSTRGRNAEFLRARRRSFKTFHQRKNQQF